MKKAKKHLNIVGKSLKNTFFPTSTELLEQAFLKASKASSKRKGVSKLLKKKNSNALKIKTMGEFLQKKIYELSKQFPRISEMDPFYIDLLGLLVDVDRLKTNLAKLNGASKIIKKIRYEYLKKIYVSSSLIQISKLLNEFMGRVSSIIKKLNTALEQLKEDSKKMKEMPSIDFEAPTIVLAGYPNVGKTTILRRLTNSKAKIATYQFTTKTINSGFFEQKYRRIQVLDTPGLLERKKKNKIEKKAFAAIKHLATLVIFVIDPTFYCGYKLKEQHALLKYIKKEFSQKKFIIVFNKSDLAKEEEMEKAKNLIKKHVIDGNDSKGELKKKIEEIL